MNKYYARIRGTVESLEKDSKDKEYCKVKVDNIFDPTQVVIILARISEKVDVSKIKEGTEVDIVCYDTSVKQEDGSYKNYNGNKMIISL